MQIIMTHLKENEDGSADVAFDVDDEGRQLIFAMGVEFMLQKAVEQAKVTTISADAPVVDREQQIYEAHLKAVEAAAKFIDGSGSELGIMTMRKAFERGYMAGVMSVIGEP